MSERRSRHQRRMLRLAARHRDPVVHELVRDLDEKVVGLQRERTQLHRQNEQTFRAVIRQAREQYETTKADIDQSFRRAHHKLLRVEGRKLEKARQAVARRAAA